MSTLLAIGSLVLLFGLPLVFVCCVFFCSGCEERRKLAAEDARQMKVARDLLRLARAERQKKVAADTIMVVRRDAKVM
jgi:hypothetical protein